MELQEFEKLMEENCQQAIADGFRLTPKVTIVGGQVCPVGAFAVNHGITDSYRAWEFVKEETGFPSWVVGAFGHGFDQGEREDIIKSDDPRTAQMYEMGERFRLKYVPNGGMIEP